MSFRYGLLCAGLLASTQAYGQGAVGPEAAYVVSATGLGVGGVAQVGASCGRDRAGICRIYLYTGTAPGAAGTLIWYDIQQPVGQRAICAVQLAAGDDASYLGTFAAGHWPVRTWTEADYWDEYPVNLVTWTLDPGVSAGLAPHTMYAINFVCPPRVPNNHGGDFPAQGAGAAPMGGRLPPQ